MIDYDALFTQLKADAEMTAALGAEERSAERTRMLVKWMSENIDPGCECGQEANREFFEHDDSCPIWNDGLEQYKENGGV